MKFVSVKAINYFRKKALSQMLDWVLNTPLVRFISQRNFLYQLFAIYRRFSKMNPFFVSILLQKQ